MKKYFINAAFLFAIVAITSWLARSEGWYTTYWYTDILLHTLSGIGFGMIWMGVNRAHTPPWFILLVGTMSFAVFGSVLWEFWEFAGWHITPYASPHAQSYFPELGDTLLDILCGAVGSIFTFFAIRIFSK